MKRGGVGLIVLLAGAFAGVRAGAETDLGGSFNKLSERTQEGARGVEGRKFSPASDRRAIFRIISWNVQTFGQGLSEAREGAYGELLEHMFATSRSAKVLALQEIAQDKGAKKFGELLPGGEERWNKSFQDTPDAQDNGYFTQKGVTENCEQLMFAERDDEGRWRSKPEKALHPVRISHMTMGDFDFTLINLHLTFAGGEVEPRVREMRNVLGWVEEYLKKPGSDPDVIIVGDFNTPMRAGRGELKGPALEDILESIPAFAPEYRSDGTKVPKPTELIALVDAPTSRSKGQPANNYDHFIVSGDVYNEEYVAKSAGQFPAKLMESIEKKHDAFVSDHLPISAGFIYKGEGNDGEPIRIDLKTPPQKHGEQKCWGGSGLVADTRR